MREGGRPGRASLATSINHDYVPTTSPSHPPFLPPPCNRICAAHKYAGLDASSGHRYIPIGTLFFVSFLASNAVMEHLRKTNEQSWDRLAEMKAAMLQKKKE